MVIHSCSFVHDTIVIIIVVLCFYFITIVSLAVARGSCAMSSRQSSRADLGGIPEGDPIENKVGLFCFLLFVFFVDFYSRDKLFILVLLFC